MSRLRTDGGGSGSAASGQSAAGSQPAAGDRSATSQLLAGLNPEEWRRRNAVAVGMDLLYLVTTAFFAHMFVRGFWPAVIASLPLAAFLYFGWYSSKPFFASQVLTAVAVGAATVTGVLSL